MRVDCRQLGHHPVVELRVRVLVRQKRADRLRVADLFVLNGQFAVGNCESVAGGCDLAANLGDLSQRKLRLQVPIVHTTLVLPKCSDHPAHFRE